MAKTGKTIGSQILQGIPSEGCPYATPYWGYHHQSNATGETLIGIPYRGYHLSGAIEDTLLGILYWGCHHCFQPGEGRDRLDDGIFCCVQGRGLIIGDGQHILLALSIRP